jgi:hypothetical protein
MQASEKISKEGRSNEMNGKSSSRQFIKNGGLTADEINSFGNALLSTVVTALAVKLQQTTVIATAIPDHSMDASDACIARTAH